jgi:hypothetical protein
MASLGEKKTEGSTKGFPKMPEKKLAGEFG